MLHLYAAICSVRRTRFNTLASHASQQQTTTLIGGSTWLEPVLAKGGQGNRSQTVAKISNMAITKAAFLMSWN
eukprot:3775145-Amphidinium_carterae.2